MFKILKKKKLAENIYLFDVEAKRVAKKCYPGEFVIVKVCETGERIPLTICDYSREENYVTVVVQAIGAGTIAMSNYEEGDFFMDFVGPLGRPSELINEDKKILKDMKILFVAGGLGAAPVYPQVKWLYEQGIKADVILGARNKELIILEDDIRAVAGNVYITTDDGSYGEKGLVTDSIRDLVINKNKKYDLCVVIGPMIMMKFASFTTKELGIKTIASMNPIMVDGTGMCGACRLTVGNEIKFACVDGPEFDAHLIDFDQAIKRQQTYKTEEGRKMLQIIEGDTHHGGCGVCGGEK